MKRSFQVLFLVLNIFGFSLSEIFAYPLIYREQLYKLHHRELYMDDADITENIAWLELSLRSDFANPLNALAVVHTPEEWEKYRNLFNMHLDLKLVELYLKWGAYYTKFNAYFYNAPFKAENLESLDIAERRITYALVYWKEALNNAKLASKNKFMYLEGISEWHDEHARIISGELDYEKIINKHLARIAQVRQGFKNMDEKTY